jgi:CubicO group peptidase (beta-lactamase class C family)
MTIGDILDDIRTKPEYQSVTLEQLLQHRAGVPGMPSTGEFAQGFPPTAGRLPVEARLALVRQVLTETPLNQGEYSYSNAGYVVAGCMAERVTKRSWEEMAQTLVFDPLKLHSAGFGWPATPQRPNQPYGHYGTSPDLKVQEIGGYTLGDLTYYRPAGDVHCSIGDLATFAAYQLRVARGQDEDLDAETLQRYWRAHELENGGTAHTFFGSGGTFLAMVAIYPQSDLAVVAATNYGLPAMPYLKAMRDAIHNRATRTPGTP